MHPVQTGSEGFKGEKLLIPEMRISSASLRTQSGLTITPEMRISSTSLRMSSFGITGSKTSRMQSVETARNDSANMTTSNESMGLFHEHLSLKSRKMDSLENFEDMKNALQSTRIRPPISQNSSPFSTIRSESALFSEVAFSPTGSTNKMKKGPFGGGTFCFSSRSAPPPNTRQSEELMAHSSLPVFDFDDKFEPPPDNRNASDPLPLHPPLKSYPNNSPASHSSRNCPPPKATSLESKSQMTYSNHPTLANQQYPAIQRPTSCYNVSAPPKNAHVHLGFFKTCSLSSPSSYTRPLPRKPNLNVKAQMSQQMKKNPILPVFDYNDNLPANQQVPPLVKSHSQPIRLMPDYDEPVSSSVVVKTQLRSARSTRTYRKPPTAPPTQEYKCKGLACLVCGKDFHTNANLIRHMRTHSDERPFKCPECDKAFRQKAHLKKHMRLHNGEKPFVCSHCFRKFTQKSTLTGHVRTKHTYETPYGCPDCPERFPTRNHLRAHRSKCIGQYK